MPPKPPTRPPPPTHFLCIPLITSSSRPQLTASISAFKQDVCSPNSFALPGDAVRPVGTLHLTLGVFSFPNVIVRGTGGSGGEEEVTNPGKERLEKAKEVLRGLKLREIWADSRKATVLVPGSTTQEGEDAKGKGREGEVKGTGSENKGEEREEITITLKGLHSIQPPAKAAVLYAPPMDDLGLLQRFCEGVRDKFRQSAETEEESPLMGDDGGRPLLLHATIVNTIYVKGKARGNGRGKGRGRERLTFDARGILDRYQDQVWMEDVKLESVAICKMGAKKILDEKGEETGDEAYEVEAEVEF